MSLLRRRKASTPELDRKSALQVVPVLNQFITVERNAEGNIVLNLPRKRTSAVRALSKVFGVSPYKQIELDALGSCVVELCDGTNTVADLIAEFAERFQLNRRESEISMLTYLKTLAKRGIVGLVVSKESAQ